MKYLFYVAAICLSLSATAQVKNTDLKKVLELKMPEGKGARASAIAWHPVQKKYYAPMSGNVNHAFAIFDAKGTRISKSTDTAMFDVRGIWYSPQLKKICANGYDYFGWIAYKLDSKGAAVGTEELFSGINQPDVHSVAAFNAKENVVYFLAGQWVVVYDAKTATEKSRLRLHAGSANESDAENSIDDADDEVMPDDYNYTTVIYTGKPKAEFGLLNVTKGEIELYNKETGYITQRLTLPDGIISDPMLCFNYANGIYWVYDKETRVWKGCK